MNIQDALKETGKAVFDGFNGTYHHVGSHNGRPDGKLRWFDDRDICLAGDVHLPDLLSEYWQPYHDKKEIRPENAGELWQLNGDNYVNMYTSPNSLYLTNVFTRLTKEISQVVHNQNGWERIHPLPEDESVERIVIEECAFLKHKDKSMTVIFPTSTGGQFNNGSFEEYVNRSPIKMILEIPHD